jgi:hypothetical protein
VLVLHNTRIRKNTFRHELRIDTAIGARQFSAESNSCTDIKGSSRINSKLDETCFYTVELEIWSDLAEAIVTGLHL